ncbi:MAG TPA: FecR domain-containing protein [Rhodoferax sp.]|nr:FecR domain-containing protein [Rhodoferax sp.]HNV60553.1 FecR domain-containing protein [Rhodoferax sp.]HPW30144.1 FecR domain-containing protein [Rhodoferax sp.]
MKIPHHKALHALLAGILAFMATSASAQTPPTPVGYVKTVTGQAWVTTAGQRLPAAPGTAIMIGSQLKTQADATLGVTFKDNTLMSFGPDTELTVDEYLYEPAQGLLKLGTNLVKGSLNYVSGVIAKLKPDAVAVKTPTGIIGVRGTQFVARVEEVK